MNPELEALIRAYDNYFSAGLTGEQRQALWEVYQSLLQATSERERVSKDAIHRAIDQRHNRWLKAQNRPAALPPKA